MKAVSLQDVDFKNEFIGRKIWDLDLESVDMHLKRQLKREREFEVKVWSGIVLLELEVSSDRYDVATLITEDTTDPV